MEVLAHELHEVRVDDVAALLLARGLGERARQVEQPLHVLGLHEVGHLARVEHVVDVLEEGLAHDLRVRD